MTPTRRFECYAGELPGEISRLLRVTFVTAVAFAALWAGPAASAGGLRVQSPAVRPGSPERVKYYVVPPSTNGHKEFLFAIAASTLGNGNLWSEIFTLNKGRLQPDGHQLENPGVIDPGWILLLPADASGPDVRFGPLPVATAPNAPAASAAQGSSGSAATTPSFSDGPSDIEFLMAGTLVVLSAIAVGALALGRRRVKKRPRRPAHARPHGRPGGPPAIDQARSLRPAGAYAPSGPDRPARALGPPGLPELPGSPGLPRPGLPSSAGLPGLPSSAGLRGLPALSDLPGPLARSGPPSPGPPSPGRPSPGRPRRTRAPDAPGRPSTPDTSVVATRRPDLMKRAGQAFQPTGGEVPAGLSDVARSAQHILVAAEQHAARVRQEADSQAVAIRARAERDAAEVKAAVARMSAELSRVAAYVTESLSPEEEAAEAARPRQRAAMRVAALFMAAMVLFAAAAGTTEIALHGFAFFVFRSAGTGETAGNGLQENQGPGQPDAPGAHHHPNVHHP